MNLLRAATLTVRDPDAAARRYEDWLGYAQAEAGRIDGALAQSWGAPKAEGRRYVVCRPSSGAAGFIRFVEGETPSDYRPLRTFGWAAVELTVSDTLKVAERMERSPFEVIGPPRPLDGMADIFPMQVKGPDEEILFLTQILRQPKGSRLAEARSLIDRPFILVLACPDLNTEARWFEETLGLLVGPPVDLRYTMISKAFGLPIETRHRLRTAGHEQDVFLELDRYPEAATPRPGLPGELPPGVAVTTLEHPDFETLVPRPAPARPGPLYDGRPHATLASPGGALVELVPSN